MAKVTHWIDSFPDSFKYSNASLVCKGLAPYGAVSIGEIDTITGRIAARGDDPDAWLEEWCAMAQKLEGEADAAAAAGRQLTAGHFYLRAGFYYYTGERFTPPGEEKRRPYMNSLRCCQEGLCRRYPQIEFV
jgi:hypothetical protein